MTNKIINDFADFFNEAFVKLEYDDKKDLIIKVIEDICEAKKLPQIDNITFSNTEDELYGHYSIYSNSININLEKLLKSHDFPCNLIDTIIHETKHYEQSYNINDQSIMLGLEGPLSSNDKDYIFQKTEDEAYTYSIKQLNKIAIKLNSKELNEYIKQSKSQLKDMKYVPGIPYVLIPFYAKTRQKEIAQKQMKEKEINKYYAKKTLKYYPDTFINKLQISMDSKLDSGQNIQCDLYIKENNNYFACSLQHNNINILELFIKENDSTICINNISNTNITKASINLAKNILDYYNEKNNKNVENSDIVFNYYMTRSDINSASSFLKLDLNEPKIKTNTDKEIDKVALKIINNRILMEKKKDLLNFTFDGQDMKSQNEMSNDMLIFKIKQLIRPDDKILINSLKQFNQKISQVLLYDILSQNSRYYNINRDFNDFDARKLFQEANIIEVIDENLETTSIDDEISSYTDKNDENLDEINMQIDIDIDDVR